MKPREGEENMRISDIAKVKVDWMEGYRNDPYLKFVLKADRKLAPCEVFRYRQSGNLFFAEHEGEVNFVVHDPGDHNGFGGRRFVLRMAEDWSPENWHDCSHNERDFGNGSIRKVSCFYDKETHSVTLTGPWSSGETVVSTRFKPCIYVSTLEGPSRETIRNPQLYRKMKKQGREYEGTYFATSYTLEFVQEVIAKLAPHLELYQGDYGWYPVIKGEQPKNPRRGRPVSRCTSILSDVQASVVEL